MSFGGWAYFLFTAALCAVLAGIIIHYFSPSRKKDVENPKHRMLDDDDE